MNPTETPTAAGSSAAAHEELLAALLAADPAFDPFTGIARGDQTRHFKAAELGLEAPRFCPVCGRRMVAQVYPYGWKARCSRHGEVTSHDVQAVHDAARDPFQEP